MITHGLQTVDKVHRFDGLLLICATSGTMVYITLLSWYIKLRNWFREELPTEEEYEEGWKNLENVQFVVGYIIMHTAPAEVADAMGFGDYE